jgi:ABC-2 type transport system ATP-binding protein
MQALRGRPGIEDVAVFGGGLHVKVDNPQDGEAAVRSALASTDIEIRTLEAIPASMEDVFVTLLEFQDKKAPK